MNRIDLQRLRAEKLIEQHWKELCDLDHGPWSEQWGAGSEISKRYLAYREACFQLRAALQDSNSSSNASNQKGLSHRSFQTCFTVRYIPGVIAGDAIQTFLEGGRGKPPFFMSAGKPIKNALGAAQSVTSTFDRLVTADSNSFKGLSLLP